MLCDNLGVVGAVAKGLSTKEPLCIALQCLAAWESQLRLKAVVQHVPGEENVLADALSRWCKKQHLLWELDWSRQHVVVLQEILEPVLTGHP